MHDSYSRGWAQYKLPDPNEASNPMKTAFLEWDGVGYATLVFARSRRSATMLVYEWPQRRGPKFSRKQLLVMNWFVPTFLLALVVSVGAYFFSVRRATIMLSSLEPVYVDTYDWPWRSPISGFDPTLTWATRTNMTLRLVFYPIHRLDAEIRSTYWD